MVDWPTTFFDTAALVADYGLPALLWLFLYLLAFERREFAERLGFGRLTFWLLGLGATLATVALLPIAPIGPDILAVSLGGGIFPLAIGAVAIGRTFARGRRDLGVWLGLLTLVGAVLLVTVLVVPSGIPQEFAVFAVGVAASAAAAGFATGPDRARRGPIAGALILTLAVAVATFVASTPIAGSGISETFPIYLLPPFGAGFVAVLTWDRFHRGPTGGALALAFAATGFGVLLGADVLREPPLYQSGYAGVYAIGGAGVFDLLYLSPLVALAAAYLAHRLLGRGVRPEDGGAPLPLPPGRPSALLLSAGRTRAEGDPRRSITTALLSAREAEAQARRLTGASPADPDRPWDGLGVPPWVAADAANLAALAQAPELGPRDADRALIAAAGQVYVGSAVGRDRFAPVVARLLAFLLDLAILTVPAALVWGYLALSTPGSLAALLNAPAFLAATDGYIALAFLYFGLTSYWGGRTLGKRALHLLVTSRSLSRPGLLASLVRESTKLVVLSVLGIGAALSVSLLLRGGALAGGATPAGISIPSDLSAFVSLAATTAGLVTLIGTVGLLFVAATDDRQRLGDLLAGTWVIRDRPTTARPGPPAPSTPAKAEPTEPRSAGGGS
ncbi:MAG: RDD family protein [Thermoplasmata archaeon]